VDDRRVISGIVHVLKSGCRWCDCPPEYGPLTTTIIAYWENLFRELARNGRSADTQMIDSATKPTIAPSCARTCTSAEPSRSFQIATTGNNRSAFSKRIYKLRWRIENTFNRLKDFRRIATRYDRLARNYLASVCLAAALVWWI
jgi:transposase